MQIAIDLWAFALLQNSYEEKQVTPKIIINVTIIII